MNSAQIDSIISKLAELTQQEFNYLDFKEKYADSVTYQNGELGKFIDHLIEKGQKIHLTLLRNHIKKEDFLDFINNVTFPVLVFYKGSNGSVHPIVIYNDQKNKLQFYDFQDDKLLSPGQYEDIISQLKVSETAADVRIHGEVIFITAFPLKYIATDHYRKESTKDDKLTPLRRLFRLISNEGKDISYIYIYAVIVGLISLALPLGIQAAISLISGGMIFSSVIVTIALVIIAILVGGALQVMQISLVEVIQQRVFAKAAFEIAFRIPKIKNESLQKYYPPELVNRFFDVVTIQKGLPKLFLDITGAVLQILFGLILLSLYHPFFLIFSLVLVGVVLTIFYVTGPKGLRTSIVESKYKYKIAFWLEEIARTVDAFKLAGSSNLPAQKMDELMNQYLYYRKAHFRVLVTQFINVVAFKTLVTGGLLIIGTILVVDRQITLGQFVASEVIIILVVGSVEKLIVSLDTIYDLLTGLDKVGKITDLPIEKQSGLRISLDNDKNGLHIRAQNVKYKYPGNTDYTLHDIEFEIKPGESICLAGPNDSGKHTLTKVLSGTLADYEGALTLNHISLRDLHLTSVRDVINKHLTFDEIFEGTILENITMGRTRVSHQDVLWAIQNVGLQKYIASLPQGLYTQIGSSGRKLSSGVVAKLLLARSVASRPKFLIINDFSEHISKNDKLKILSFLQEKSNGWTLMIISVNDDPILLSSCDKILLMNKGRIAAQGAYEQLLSDRQFQNLIFRGR